MIPALTVTKYSGEKEAFSPQKLNNSLQRSGASSLIAEEIVQIITSTFPEQTTTKEIYKKAFSLLRKKKKHSAARYSLKRAIMELGPSGYPFEKFIAELFAAKGYTVKTNQTLNGQCVTHEIDVLAENHQETILVECKFGNAQSKISGVKVPLYIHSRFNDVTQMLHHNSLKTEKHYRCFIVTNTRFSEDATAYARCAGINLVSWDFPGKDSLREWVENSHLFPITILTSLNKQQKQKLIDQGIVLCRELSTNFSVTDQLNLSPRIMRNLRLELHDLVSLD